MEEEKKEAADGEEEKKEEDEEKKEVKIVRRDFDPEKDGKSWAGLDLGGMFAKNNQKKGLKEAKVVTVKTKSEPVRIKNDVQLKLTEQISFSMTDFSKPNKGFTNV